MKTQQPVLPYGIGDILPSWQLDTSVQGLVESPKHIFPPAWFDIWTCLLWTPDPQETLQGLHNDQIQSTKKHMKYTQKKI